MKLHRVEGKSDWSDVPPERRNGWQRLAARTGGIITIGNVFSLLGLVSAPVGLLFAARQQFVAAVVVLALGRVCDLLDGWLADKTGTKSPLGEKIDASFDKIVTAAVLIGLVMLEALPGLLAVLLAAPHILIALLALGAFARGKQFHPSRIGKLSMAAVWLAILTFLILQALRAPDEGYVWVLALGAFWLAVGLGLAALIGYVIDLYRSFRGS